MRKNLYLCILLLVSLLCACVEVPGRPSSSSGEATTWQEQYDLGLRYLSEGNYEEAIIAFSAAIEIDPKQAPAYVGRGDAYIGLGETEENLTAAKADYEKAIELDELLPEAYLGLADVYIRQGDYDKALEILQRGLEKIGENQEISDKINEIEQGNITDSSGKTRRSSHFEDGALIEYWLYDYDERGNNIKTVCYLADGTLRDTEEAEFNEKGQMIRMTKTGDGEPTVFEYEYDAQGRKEKEISITDGGYMLIAYSDDGRTETHDSYDVDSNFISRFEMEYDEAGIRTKGSYYTPDPNGGLKLGYYVIYIWNEDGTYGGYELFNVD